MDLTKVTYKQWNTGYIFKRCRSKSVRGYLYFYSDISFIFDKNGLITQHLKLNPLIFQKNDVTVESISEDVLMKYKLENL